MALSGSDGPALVQEFNSSKGRCGNSPFPPTLVSALASAARLLLREGEDQVRGSRIGTRLLWLLRDEQHGTRRIARARLLSWLRYRRPLETASQHRLDERFGPLFEAWTERHDAVRHWLWASNLRLAVRCLRNSGLPRSSQGDLLLAATDGLDRALDSYEPAHEASFSTYAFTWIRSRSQREAWSSDKPLRATNHLREGWRKLWRAEAAFRLREGCVPALEELSEEAEVELSVMMGWLASRRLGPPANLCLSSDGTRTLDRVPHPTHPTSAEFAWQTKAERLLARAIESLPPRTQRVLRRRFGMDRSEPATLSEIGRELDLSRERVRQIEREGLHGIRAEIDALADAWCRSYGLVPDPMTPPTS